MKRQIYPLKVNKDLWARFKSACALVKKDMVVVIVEAIEKFVEENEK